MHDAFRNGESQAGSFGIQAAGYERLEDLRQDVGRNAGTIVFNRDRDPGLRVSIPPPGIYRDTSRRTDRIQRVAKQVDEDLDQAIGIAGYQIVFAYAIPEVHLRGFFVDGYQVPRIVDEVPQRYGLQI